MTRVPIRVLVAAALAAGVLAAGAAPASAQTGCNPWCPPIATPTPRDAPPVNLALPRIYGEPVAGSQLESDEGTWSGLILRTSRRWQRLEDGLWSDIAGATGFAYEPTSADIGRRVRLAVRVTGITAAVAAYSEPTLPVAPRPVPPPVPTATPAPLPAATVVPPATPTPSPEPLIAFPIAVFRGTGLPAITLRWGERRTISGTLSRPDGRPVAGARLSVTSRLEMLDAVPVALGQVATNARGGFTYTPAVGASRAITFAFADAFALRRATVTLRVVPRITIRLTRGGVDGRVAGAPPGVRKLVELQALSGRTWSTFATTRLAPTGGTFTAGPRVPFRRVRALIRADANWPFLTGVSPPATHRR